MGDRPPLSLPVREGERGGERRERGERGQAEEGRGGGRGREEEGERERERDPRDPLSVLRSLLSSTSRVAAAAERVR